MADPRQSEVEQQLVSLQTNFKKSLPRKVQEIAALWDAICVGGENNSLVADCYRMAHNLVGSGGTFGAVVVSTASKELVDAIKPILEHEILSSDIKAVITKLVQELKNVADSWQPSKVPYLPPLEKVVKGRGKGNLIYLAEDDELLAEDLTSYLQRDNFVVKHFSNLDNFVAAVRQEMPSAIIMDIIFKEGDIAGADTIEKLKSEFTDCPPIIFISVRNDINARLAAAKAGAQRYFSKPLNKSKLSNTIDGLIERTKILPYRVLLVDDDVSMLEYYETVLAAARMEVLTISNPMNSLDAIEKFKPDVIVLDVYMQECSGPEVAQVLRQDDRWAMTPIMFLSVESDLGIQLDSMNLGGESFMVKPITANHLVTAITIKAKRARWNYRIKNDFKIALRESEYQIITSDQHNIVSSADIAGRIISVNDKFCEISGYRREELIGNNHRLLKSKYHPESFFDDMWQTIASGQVWHGTICNYNKAGEEYWVESTIVPFLDEKGKPYKYVSARTDVTKVIQSEERLERSQDFANIGTWDWNIITGSLFWSDRIWPLFGYDKKSTATTYDNFMAAIHPDDCELVSTAVKDCIENGTEYNIEHRVVWKDGSVRWLHESGDVVRDSEGKALHMLGVVQDVTERKSAEQFLVIAREEAETANRAKSQFLSSMSHELRTPMNAIMGFGQLLNLEIDNPLNKNQKENVNEILKASDHLLELINDVLDLSQIEAGRIELSIEDVLLGSVLTESLQLILPLANRRGITIKMVRGESEVELSDLIRDTNIIRADHTRTKQVLINLLSNAVKYNKENGTITIKCDISNGQSLRVSVIDTGEGLAQEQCKKLFTAFNRLGAENTEIEGTGIGLVITKNIVELMGGKIGVESTQGVGSTFWFELPGSTNEIDVNVKVGDLTCNEIDFQEQRTVLYIEDNPANLRLVTQLLGRIPNLHMWSAHEPMLGLELAVENNPDLILLDINLPGMDGYAVLQQLRQREATRNTPVIAISANAMPKDIEKGLQAGFDDYITKPINVKQLLQAVSNFIERGRSE